MSLSLFLIRHLCSDKLGINAFVIAPADSGDLLHGHLGRCGGGWIGMDLLHAKKKSPVGARVARETLEFLLRL